MEIINNPSQVEIKKAAQALKDGHLVAFPTETVYGLGADATNEKAVSRVYSVKARPTDHPLIVHISSINQLGNWAIDIPEYAIKLAEKFWPGPMTLILKRSEIAKEFITGGQQNVGVRVPSHPVALALLSEFKKLGGLGVAAPSANRFGSVSATTAKAVEEDLSKYLSIQDLILDGASSSIGLESTIINCTDSSPDILRPGAVTKEMIELVTTIKTIRYSKNEKIRVSGNLSSHYAPKAQVVIGEVASIGDGYIALSEYKTLPGVIRLAAPNSIEEFAKVLYSAFRNADQIGLNRIVVALPSGNGLALAIRDRVIKASRK
jgi:L-threonylcarbamoyladenylate synthase